MHREELNRIKQDESVRVLDKSLEPALVSTDWLKTETLRQLNDRQSYTIISNEGWIVKHGQVISTRGFYSTYSGRLNTLTKLGRSLVNTNPAAVAW